MIDDLFLQDLICIRVNDRYELLAWQKKSEFKFISLFLYLTELEHGTVLCAMCAIFYAPGIEDLDACVRVCAVLEDDSFLEIQ